MQNDIAMALSPDTTRLMRAGLNDVLFAGNDADMRNSAVLAAQELVINTVKALGKSADDVLTVFGMIRAKKPRSHAELSIACQIIIAEDRALKTARLARQAEASGDLSRAMQLDAESRKSNALALKHSRALLRHQRKHQRYNGTTIRSAVVRNTRW